MTLGIDPGYGRLGYAFVRYENGFYRIDASGCIHTPKTHTHSARLMTIHTTLVDLIETYAPKSAAVETLFFAKNTKTALQVAEARGVILLTLMQHNLLTNEYTPNQIKQAVTGSGRAKKDDIIRMVNMLTKHADTPITQDDAADACAVGICDLQHANNTPKYMERMI